MIFPAKRRAKLESSRSGRHSRPVKVEIFAYSAEARRLADAAAQVVEKIRPLQVQVKGWDNPVSAGGKTGRGKPFIGGFQPRGQKEAIER